jgi:FixJ family two-component response regulator
MSTLPIPTVAVVDDDEPMCRALERSLRGHGFRVRTYTSALRYLSERDALDPQCVVADINMPELDGVEMRRAEREGGHDVPTVFITGRVDVRTAVRAMKEGALDLLEKPVEESVLLGTVRRAIDRSSALRAERRELAAVWKAFDLLTPREAEVCALVASGMRNKQIAAAIGTTEKTVKVHRARVMEKLAIDSITDLVRLVDRAVGDPTDMVSLAADWRSRRRPRALEVVSTALVPLADVRADERPSTSMASLRRLCEEAAEAADTYY